MLSVHYRTDSTNSSTNTFAVMILQKGIIQIEQRAISQGAPGNN